jgi:titin
VDGLALQNGGGDVLQGNYIGTDVTGTQARGNARQGVLVNSAGNLITGNVISGNGNDGLQVAGTGATGNLV